MTNRGMQGKNFPFFLFSCYYCGAFSHIVGRWSMLLIAKELAEFLATICHMRLMLADMNFKTKQKTAKILVDWTKSIR